MPEEKDEGTHTSSQLQSVNLPFYTKIVGVLCQLSSDDSGIHIKIGNKTLCILKESIEYQIALDKLHQGLIGQKIGLLRTDEPTKPLVVRVVDR